MPRAELTIREKSIRIENLIMACRGEIRTMRETVIPEAINAIPRLKDCGAVCTPRIINMQPEIFNYLSTEFERAVLRKQTATVESDWLGAVHQIEDIAKALGVKGY